MNDETLAIASPARATGPAVRRMNAPDAAGGGLRAQLSRAARGSVLVRVGALASALAGSIVLARALGPDGFGIYAFVFATVTLLALPSQVGIPTLLVRETAKAQATAAWPTMRGLWRWATRTILATSLAIAALAAAVVFALGDRLSEPMRWTLFAGFALVPLIALGNARGAALRGLRRIVAGQLPEMLLRPLLLAVLVGIGWFAAGRLAAATAMWLHVVAAALSFAIGAGLLWRARPPELAGVAPDASAAAAWRAAALPLALVAGLQVVGNQAGVVLLGVFRSAPEVSMFKVAVSASALAVFGLQTANAILGPYVARLHATGEHARLQKIAGLGAGVSAALTIPVFLVFAFGGDRLVAVLYGGEYVGAYLPLLILGAGQVVNALFGSVGLLLNMTGHERDTARWLSVAAVAQLLVSLALIPQFGMAGAALGTVLSTVIWNVALWIVAKRRLGVDGSIAGAFAAWSRR